VYCINLFACVDSFKGVIYLNHNLKVDLIKLITKVDNKWERLFAIKLLWNLCFNKDVLLDVSQNDDLISFIDTHSNETCADFNDNCMRGYYVGKLISCLTSRKSIVLTF